MTFLLNLIRMWIVVIPKMNEVANPAKAVDENVSLSRFRIMFAPRTTGRDIRKESFSARVSSNFRRSRVETVVPDLERPGSVASPWVMPAIIESECFSCLFVLIPFLFFTFN